jgi:hypothetical protein
MIGMLLLTLAVVAQEPTGDHVRSANPRIRAVVSAGLSRSQTFRELVAALDASDVIVYVEPKMSRNTLGGYLSHGVVATGRFRYLRISIDISGGPARVLSLLAHELQHALEVANAPDVRDADGLERLFSRTGVAFGCGGSDCYETRAARDIEVRVRDEWAAR